MELGKFITGKLNKLKQDKENKMFAQKSVNFLLDFNFDNPDEGYNIQINQPTVTEDLSDPMVNKVSGVEASEKEHTWVLSKQRSLTFYTENYTFDAIKYEEGISVVLLKGEDKICVIGQHVDFNGKSHINCQVLNDEEMLKAKLEIEDKLNSPKLKTENKKRSNLRRKI